MGLTYSIATCREALRILSSADSFESRLSNAFSGMTITMKGDTSDDIWKDWERIEKSYLFLSRKISEERGMGLDVSDSLNKLNQLSISFVGLLCDWIEFNSVDFSKIESDNNSEE